MRIMENLEIREKAKNSGVRLWQIADKLGINDGNLSRKLRKELSQQDRDRILLIIDELSKEAT